MKTFYTLTPEAFEACVKLDQALDNLAAINEFIDIDPVSIDEQADESDIFYLFKQYNDGEFCDHDFFNGRQINFSLLEQNGLIKETFVKDPTQI